MITKLHTNIIKAEISGVHVKEIAYLLEGVSLSVLSHFVSVSLHSVAFCVHSVRFHVSLGISVFRNSRVSCGVNVEFGNENS